ncbi:MAG: response regulator [Anaerolineae bacterium]|nr:response regulator [Anaerolineae bacterium]
MNKRPTVLLMDEDAETLEQLQTMLLRVQYHVLAAVDGHAALRLARTAKPDLIVSDLLLSSLDGYEVWRILRTDPETAHIPILVTSALTIPESNQPWRPTPDSEWQLLYYDAYLPKPIDLRRFMHVVEKLLLPEQAHDIPGGPSVILAIEDEKTGNQLAAILKGHDFGFTTTTSLSRALQLVRAVPPAALILDYRVPDETIRNTIIQINKLVPTTVIILLISPHTDFDKELLGYCDGLLTTPLHAVHTITSLNRVLELCGTRRRTRTLSTQLITATRNLRDIQQMLKAQNQELEYINARLRELDSLKEMFTSMIVHDLKSPLGAILGALNFLEGTPDDKPNPASHALITGATAAGNQMLRLIQTLLERQRLEDGHLKPDAEPFLFSHVVETCLQQISSLLTLHHLEIKKEIAADLPVVYADPHISQRIFENLLDNAIKFSPRNGTITIQIVPENDYIRVSIQDQGPGIPKEHQARIFDLFTQLENADSVSRAGFGMGLTFCQLATQALDGTIWVESDGETGTTFLFTLPVYHEDE